MSRYTIDGQILSDMAVAIRTKKYGFEPMETVTAYVVDWADAETGEVRNQNFVYKPKLTRNKIIIESIEWINSFPHGFVNVMEWYDTTNRVMIKPDTELPQTIIANGQVNFGPSYVECNVIAKIIPLDENDEPLTYTPEEMVAAINALPPGLSEEDLCLTGNKTYAFAQNAWNWFIVKMGDQVTTKDINNMAQMFYYSDALKEIPFDINGSSYVSMTQMFYRCRGLTAIPNISLTGDPTNMNEMFYDCDYVKTIPADMGTGWDWATLEASNTAYKGNMSSMFRNCYSITSVPVEMISHCNLMCTYNYALYANGFNQCYNLEEINNLCVPYNGAWTSNAFTNTFNKCERLKDVIFKTQEDGTPFVASGWKNQVIDLTTVGFGSTCKTYNSNLTDENKVDNMTAWHRATSGTWEDYWVPSVDYSVYGRESAVRTINSLPDVSGSGGTNTIKFNANGARLMGIQGGSGKSIAELSQEEIAVAAAKGWTVTLA